MIKKILYTAFACAFMILLASCSKTAQVDENSSPDTSIDGSIPASTMNQSPPSQTQAPGLSAAISQPRQISADEYYAAAITSDGTLLLWDFNQHMASYSAAIHHYEYEKIMEDALSVSAAGGIVYVIKTDHYQAVAVKNDGSLWAWGGGWSTRHEPAPTPTPHAYINRATPSKIIDL